MAYIAPPTRATGDLITAAIWNQDVGANFIATFPGATSGYTAYTPALTTFDVGSGTVTPTLGTGSSATGRYLQVGKLVQCSGIVAFGTAGTAAGTGGYLISLPVAQGNNRLVGQVWLHRNTNNNGVITTAYINASTTFYMQYPATAPIGVSTYVTESFPWAWAASDQLQWVITYEAA